MEALKAQLKAMGIPVDKLTDEKLCDVAKALGFKLPRKVEVVQYTGKASGKTETYIKTGNYAIENGTEKPGTAKGLFLRVEVIDSAIEDLFLAKDLLEKQGK